MTSHFREIESSENHDKFGEYLYAVSPLIQCFFLPRKMSTSQNSTEEGSSPILSDKALEKVHKHIKDAVDILRQETDKVRKEKEAFDEKAKKLEHIHFSEMVQLNVGGHLFSTSLATLTKDPGIFKLHKTFL